jgi:hypothetical protein
VDAAAGVDLRGKEQALEEAITMAVGCPGKPLDVHQVGANANDHGAAAFGAIGHLGERSHAPLSIHRSIICI